MMKRGLLILLPLLLCIGTVSAKADETSTEGTTEEDEVKFAAFKERRVDREINKRMYIHKGEVMLGASASYNSLTTDNAEYLTLITDMNIDGSITTIKPFGAYFYRDNRAIGARFGYLNYSGVVESTTLDLGESNGVTFDVPYINLSSTSYSYAIFHRAYAPLDNQGNFGVFAEVELSATHGETNFTYEDSNMEKSTYSENNSYDLSFNPGISAFLFHNVCASLSFQFGGLNYTNIKQYDEQGEYVGSRDSSKMRFMFNVFAINFGVTVHLW